MTKKQFSYFSFLAFVLIAVPSFSSVRTQFDRKPAPLKKMNKYIRDGQFFGGKSGSGYSLTDIRRVYSPADRVERIILEFGDENGAATSDIAYFQVNLYKNLKRIDVDMAQMRGSAVAQEKVIALFKASPLVRSAKLNYDPEDRSLILQVDLKAGAELEVVKMPGVKKHSKIALDIRKI